MGSSAREVTVSWLLQQHDETNSLQPVGRMLQKLMTYEAWPNEQSLLMDWIQHGEDDDNWWLMMMMSQETKVFSRTCCSKTFLWLRQAFWLDFPFWVGGPLVKSLPFVHQVTTIRKVKSSHFSVRILRFFFVLVLSFYPPSSRFTSECRKLFSCFSLNEHPSSSGRCKTTPMMWFHSLYM